MSLFAALASLLMAAATPVDQQCTPIRGWEQLLADDKMRWIVIGEIHGSNETPEIFADAVCLTASSRPVVVAVEQPSLDQGAIDSFMASDGGTEAKRAFLGARMWNISMKDGRSSEAYFRLFETLRRMHAAGRIRAVVAFQPFNLSERPTPAGYEEAMADLLLANAQPGATMIALVGNVHAMRAEVPFQPSYMAMAGHLPREATVTLNTVSEGGEAWICSGGPASCGVGSVWHSRSGHPRGVELNADDQGPYSGVIYLGTYTTASRPQANPAPTAD